MMTGNGNHVTTFNFKMPSKLDSKKFVKMRDDAYVYNSLTIEYEGYDDRKRKSYDY